MKFEPQSVLPDFETGAASGTVCPSKLAAQVGCAPHGAWLTAYMIRRFGPPLCGCDDYKNLCEWSLTTPMPGVWLSVTPYLGDTGEITGKGTIYESGGLSFGYRFAKGIDEKCGPTAEQLQPVRHWRRKAIQWAVAKGITTCWHPEETEPVRVCPSQYDPPFEETTEQEPWLVWWPPYAGRGHRSWLACEDMWGMRPVYAAYAAKFGECPKWPRGNTQFLRSVNAALKCTLRSLMQPIFVRDLCFGIGGRVEPEYSEEGEPLDTASRHPNSGNGMKWAAFTNNKDLDEETP